MPWDGKPENWDLPPGHVSDLALLRAARAGIADPTRWCQRDLVDHGQACAVGWMFRVSPAGYPDSVRLVASTLYPALPLRWRMLRQIFFSLRWDGEWGMVVLFNDAPWRRHAQMVALFDAAIRREERRARADMSEAGIAL